MVLIYVSNSLRSMQLIIYFYYMIFPDQLHVYILNEKIQSTFRV